MTLEMWVIAAVRVAGSLPVLRWPLAGAVLAILVDFSDLFLRSWLELGGVRNYQEFDKYLDLVYMVTFLIVALRWPDPERTVLVVLFVFRIAGVAVFEISGERGILLFFPNLFEFFFVFVAAQKQFWPSFEYTAGMMAVVLGALLIPKVFQEYALHEARWLDDYVATEVVEDWWEAVF
jgi:hypothetical protein